MIQLIFGWPGMALAMVLAITGIYLRKRWLLLTVGVLLLPSSFYFFGANNWVRLMGIYIPLSAFISAFYVESNRLVPALLLTPIILFYSWLGYSVATQVTGPDSYIPMPSPPSPQ